MRFAALVLSLSALLPSMGEASEIDCSGSMVPQPLPVRLNIVADGVRASRRPQLLSRVPEAERGKGRILVRLNASAPFYSVDVIDNGIGLGGRSAADLVDPFHTTKEPGEGLGLGLSIAFNVMQDMGGHLEIGQHAEGGAEVTLRLNRWQAGRAQNYG